jgi:Na+/H+-dicarboxylate symporter
MSISRVRHSHFGLIVGLAILVAQPAMAYAGPGAGLSMIGSLLALVGAVLAGIFGFVWYPLKRILKRRKHNAESADDE